MGVPLWDTEQRILGHLAVLDTRPLRDDKSKIIGKMAFLTDMAEHNKSLALAGEILRSLLL